LWLKQSLDDSTPLDGNIFLSRCGSRFYPPFFFIIISINNYITVASKMASPKTSKGRIIFWMTEWQTRRSTQIASPRYYHYYHYYYILVLFISFFY
jgi:hypothetical protein